MKDKSNIPGAFVPVAPRKNYRLRRTIEQAASSEAAIDLLLECALGQQPERALTAAVLPRWAAAAMEAAHG